MTEHTAHDAVDALAEVAADSIRTAQGAGVSLIGADGQRSSIGATSKGVREADDLQYELGQGPCLSAWATGEPVYVRNTHTDDRWEKWMAAAARSGIRSCFTVPLLKQPTVLGAMKVYSKHVDAFSKEDQKLLSRLARSASALLGHVQASDFPQRISEELKVFLVDRDSVGIARGILMERHGLDERAAMHHLLDLATSTDTTVGFQAKTIRGYSNDHNTSSFG